MKSLKKILAAFMAIMLIFSLSACSSDDDEEVAPAGTTAVETSKLTVAVLFESAVEKNEDGEIIQDGIDVNFIHRNGLAAAQGYLGMSAEKVIVLNGRDAKDTEAINETLSDLKSCHVIIGTSYNYLPLFEAAAEKEEFKGIVFAVYAGNSAEASSGKALPKLKNTNNNIMFYGADMHEAAYLSGIAAGMKAKEEKKATIGYVAPADNNNAEVTAAVNAFALGAQSVYDKATVKVSVVSDWTNEDAVNKAVDALEAAKCKVISKYYETDEDAFCSTVWHMENAYISLFTTISRGEWTPVNYFGGITEGVVDVKVNEEKAAEGTKDAVKAAKKDLMNADFVLFDKGIEKADGTKLDNAIANENIRTEMNYYVKGVSLLK